MPCLSVLYLIVGLLCLLQALRASKLESPGFTSGNQHVITLSWAVHITCSDNSKETLDALAQDVAVQSSLINQGQIGNLLGHYVLSHELHLQHHRKQLILTSQAANTTALMWQVKAIHPDLWETITEQVHQAFDTHPAVYSYTQQGIRPRQKRQIVFDDPEYGNQWHLHNYRHFGMDINVRKVWERNVTGRGIVTAVVDDGLEWTNPDLRPNYSAEGSYDLNNDHSDPMPSVNEENNHHGTRCAGEIAAVANNDICAVGVAYNAKIAGLKILDGPMTDSLEATAFTKMLDIVDVYSCSWGPDDDGQTVDGPHRLAQKGLHHAVDYGRQGYGNIFVVASGNGGLKEDNCNFDGYATSIYTVTVGAVDEAGAMPYYAEECASMLAVTYSSGAASTRSIVTTDWSFRGATGCTRGHTGTSAAAPLAAGMVALMLEAQPCLTWRDVQHIIVMSANKVDIDVAHWYRNQAGLHHSHKHGFGLMDAWDMVNAAKTWDPVPWMTSFSSPDMEEHAPIPANNQPLTLTYTVSEDMLFGYDLLTLEYVHVTLTMTHRRRGDLEIRLTCPSATESILATTRKYDLSGEGYKPWTFGTVRCWGEAPQGIWTLTIWDRGRPTVSRGTLVKWELRMYGSPMSTDEVKDRIQKAKDSQDGRHLYSNVSAPCRPAPIHNQSSMPLSERTLKLLALISAFCLFSAVCETLEYALCYNKEKEEHKKLMAQMAEAHRRAQQQNGVNEHTRLLDAEEIPLQDLQGSGCGGGVEGQTVETSFRSSYHELQGASLEAGQSEPSHSSPVIQQASSDTYQRDTSRAASQGHQDTLEYLISHTGLPRDIVEKLTPEEIRLNLGTLSLKP